MRTTASGALDLRVRDSDSNNLAPELLEQAGAAASSATTVRTLEAHSRNIEAHSRNLEAKSRAIHNIVVPVMVIAAFALVALRPHP